MNRDQVMDVIESLVSTYDEFDTYRKNDDTIDILYPRGTEVKESTATAIIHSELKSTDVTLEELEGIGEGVRVKFI